MMTRRQARHTPVFIGFMVEKKHPNTCRQGHAGPMTTQCLPKISGYRLSILNYGPLPVTRTLCTALHE
jgi:hypothetical protein